MLKNIGVSELREKPNKIQLKRNEIEQLIYEIEDLMRLLGGNQNNGSRLLKVFYEWESFRPRLLDSSQSLERVSELLIHLADLLRINE